MQVARTLVRVLAVIATACTALPVVHAQTLEPRSYTNTPVGINFVVGGLGYMTGDVVSDAATPIENAQIDSWLPVVGYARSFGLAGRSGKIDVIAPMGCLEGSADFRGEHYERDTCGAGDPSFKASLNLYGAPAITLAELPAWRQDLIVGVGLRVTTPWGAHDSNKLLNVGANSWTFKPEIGLSKAIGRVTVELIGAVALHGDNDSYFGHKQREQDPVYSLQGHLIYAFRNGAWLALNATGYHGGRTTIDGIENDDLQRNSRLGVTLTMPVNRRNSFKVTTSTGTTTRTGGDFDAIALLWQYRWGGGL